MGFNSVFKWLINKCIEMHGQQNIKKNADSIYTKRLMFLE